METLSSLVRLTLQAAPSEIQFPKFAGIKEYLNIFNDHLPIMAFPLPNSFLAGQGDPFKLGGTRKLVDKERKN